MTSKLVAKMPVVVELELARVSKATLNSLCPCCGSCRTSVFYEVCDVPVHSVILIRTRETALSFPTGDVALSHCSECGFIFNAAFDQSRLNYSAEYEETQGFSPIFSAFHVRLAEDLIRRHDLHSKRIIEIGCGKGDFLNLLCTLGDNSGVGFDPAFIPERDSGSADDRTTFIRDFYSEKYADYSADFICCKMTLEHINQPARLIGAIRRSIGDQSDPVVFFQLPEARRVLQELAFWDVYYEHCSYFSMGTLVRLFRSKGFEVLNIWTDYDDQYLMIEARIDLSSSGRSLPPIDDLAVLEREVTAFEAAVEGFQSAWKRILMTLAREGRKVVLWGGGSKAVAFLTTLGIRGEVLGAVDVNPYKQGTFIARSGHPILAPRDLTELRPDVVIVMNPVYELEVSNNLSQLGVNPSLLCIDEDPRSLMSFSLEAGKLNLADKMSRSKF